MTFASALLLILWQVLIPVAVGSFFNRIYKGKGRLIFYWISGQMMIWAGFQLFTVPLILRNQEFHWAVRCTVLMVIVLLILRAALFLWRREWRCSSMKVITGGKTEEVLEQSAKTRLYILYLMAGALLLFQLVMTVCYAYEEGDDAFYLAITTITTDANTMYMKNPYTGGTTGLDVRHGLAPFPIWLAFLCEMVGGEPVFMTQVVLSLVLILMAYGIHYLMGNQLFRGNREQGGLYFLLVEVLTIFGGYSTYSTGNFLLVRITQGKAVLCNLVLPFMLLLYLMLLERWQKEEKISRSYWLLHMVVAVAGCLCSTQGGLLVCMLLGLFGLCSAVVYRRFRHLLPLAISCCMPVGYMLLYVLLG